MGLLSTLGGIAGNFFAPGIGGALGGALGSALEGGAQVAGGNQQSLAAQQAAQQAAAASQFRPVGITNTFGTSNFGYDDKGNLTSAGYNLSPQLQGAQNTLMGGLQGSLQDQANIQAMGRQYMATSPQEQAQQYMMNQQALLQPSRDLAQSRLNTNLFNQGTGGLSVAQGGNLGMANPQQQALANAQALQDLQLAAQATQAGQQQYTFGQGLLSSAYDPYKANLSTSAATEALGQQPFDISTALGAKQATAGSNAGRYMTMDPYSYSPSGNMLTQIGNASAGVLGSTDFSKLFGTQGGQGAGGGITSAGMLAPTYTDVYGGGALPFGYANF
jgi:hypothetical protein